MGITLGATGGTGAEALVAVEAFAGGAAVDGAGGGAGGCGHVISRPIFVEKSATIENAMMAKNSCIQRIMPLGSLKTTLVFIFCCRLSMSMAKQVV